MIVEILPKTEHRSLFTIYVDGEPWKEIHRTIFGRKPTLPKNVQTQDELETAFEEAEYTGARRYAIWRLARFAQSAHALATALERVSVSEVCRQRIIDEMIQAGFLNDRDYAKRLVASERARKRGPAAARRKLYLKGIDNSLAMEALQEIDEETQKATIQQLLSTRYAKQNLADPKARRKVVAALARRGFSMDLILSLQLPLKNIREPQNGAAEG